MTDEAIEKVKKSLDEKISNEFNNDDFTKTETRTLLDDHPEYIRAHIYRAQLFNDRIKEDTARLLDERKSRKWYGRTIFGFVAIYIGAVLFVVACNPHLSEKVEIALLGSANINIIGLLMGVVHYLFPKPKI